MRQHRRFCTAVNRSLLCPVLCANMEYSKSASARMAQREDPCEDSVTCVFCSWPRVPLDLVGQWQYTKRDQGGTRSGIQPKPLKCPVRTGCDKMRIALIRVLICLLPLCRRGLSESLLLHGMTIYMRYQLERGACMREYGRRGGGGEMRVDRVWMNEYLCATRAHVYMGVRGGAM